MAKLKEDDSLSLKKIVKSVQLHCQVTPNMKIGDAKNDKDVKNLIEDLQFAAGKRALSKLCGFSFVSANTNTEYKEFSIAFVAKTASNIGRKDTTNPRFRRTKPQWFIFKTIKKARNGAPIAEDVLSKNECYINYGLDIDSFFKTPLFKKGVTLFKQAIAAGITKIKKFIADVKSPADVKEITACINAIESSIKLIDDLDCSDKYWKLEPAVNKLTEFDSNDDASRFKCKVTKVKEDGEDAWQVETVVDKRWVATFTNEEDAKLFAEKYPAMKLNYIKKLKARTNETSEDTLNEAAKPPLKWNKMIDQIKEKCMLAVSNVVNAQKDFSPAEEIIEQLQRELDYYAFSDINSEGSIYDTYFAGWSKGTSIMSASNESSAQKSQDEIDEQELDAKIEDAMKKIYDAEDEMT